MENHVFFYGTLMVGFDRRQRSGVDDRLTYLGRGWVQGSLYDLGLYPAAVPASEGRIWGELYRMEDPAVLSVLDNIEGYDHQHPDRSLYHRSLVPVTLSEGLPIHAWVYFYNAPLGQAPLIPSGDYHER